MKISGERIGVEIKPATEYEEIIQNVRTILMTERGSVPLDRDFGIERKVMDVPLNVARARLSAAVVKAVNEGEPRVRVRKVYFEQANYDTIDGILKPCVEVELVKEKLRGYVNR